MSIGLYSRRPEYSVRKGITQHDRKLQDVFVQKQPQSWMELGDFEPSKQQNGQTAFCTHAGTQQYMAPELF